MSKDPGLILLVEDDAAHAEVVRRSLAGAHTENLLVHVADGQEALDYLYRRDRFSDPSAARRPGLVLLDLHLPRVDGLEVLRTIKADARLSQIPVVMLTTSADESDMKRAYDCHANSYLVKPADCARFSELLETVGSYWLSWNRQ